MAITTEIRCFFFPANIRPIKEKQGHAFGIFPTKRNDLLVLVCAASEEDTFGMTPLGNLAAKAISITIERPVGHGNYYR